MSKIKLIFRDQACYERLLRTIARRKKITFYRLEEILSEHQGLTIEGLIAEHSDTPLQKLVMDQMNAVYLDKGSVDKKMFTTFHPQAVHTAARKYFLRLLDNDYQMTFHDYPVDTSWSVQLMVYRALCAYSPFEGLDFLQKKADPEVARKLVQKISQSTYTNAKMAYMPFYVVAWFHIEQMPEFETFKQKIMGTGHERDPDVLNYVNTQLKSCVLNKARQLHQLL